MCLAWETLHILGNSGKELMARISSSVWVNGRIYGTVVTVINLYIYLTVGIKELSAVLKAVSYTHLTLPTNREV